MVAALLCMVALAGCLSIPTPMPSYVLLLTTINPHSNGRCTGVALDARTILTADHCVENVQRAVTVSGQAVGIQAWLRWPAQDAALLRALQPLTLPEYATLADVEPTHAAAIYAVCPWYFAVTPRLAVYNYPWFTNIDNTVRLADQWNMLLSDQYTCGGDSGGVLLQTGGVVGIVSAVRRANSEFDGGQVLYSVPATTIRQLMEQHDAQNRQARPAAPDALERYACARAEGC